eukprot:scaffold108832_cov35-Tisochrysis_lutea.AAC.2
MSFDRRRGLLHVIRPVATIWLAYMAYLCVREQAQRAHQEKRQEGASAEQAERYEVWSTSR